MYGKVGMKELVNESVLLGPHVCEAAHVFKHQYLAHHILIFFISVLLVSLSFLEFFVYVQYEESKMETFDTYKASGAIDV